VTKSRNAVAYPRTQELHDQFRRQHPDDRPDQGQGDDRVPEPGRLRESLRGAAEAVTPQALRRSHRLFAVLVLLALAPRILAALSFRPALLTADSFLYLRDAVDGRLGNIRPSGYSFFVSIFQGFTHALLVVTTVQHLMGIAIAIIVYVLLRYWGLPGWGAALAAAPTLFDVREIALESYILPDTLFCLVLMIAVALLLTKRTPRAWQCVGAGLLLAYASVLRGNGIPLAVVVAAFLLVRKVGWKALVAASVAFVVPLLGYVLVFHSQYGTYNVTASDGIFLWSRTTSFANCAIIKPPPDLQPLCPDRETSVRVPPAANWSVSHLLSAPTPEDYLWAPDAWWRHDAQPGVNPHNSKLGQRFAIDAITAQPLGYLRVVSRDVLLTFAGTDRPQGNAYMTFTPRPRIAALPSYYRADLKSYAGTQGNTHAVYPYAFFTFLYQQFVIFPGLVFGLVILAGLVGVARNWRRWGGLQGLPWALAAVSIVSPAVLTQSLYRYAIVAVPLACLAAGLGFARLPGRRLEAAASDDPEAATAPAAADASPADAEPAAAELADAGPADAGRPDAERPDAAPPAPEPRPPARARPSTGAVSPPLADDDWPFAE
jgi:hypothetical protein